MNSFPMASTKTEISRKLLRIPEVVHYLGGAVTVATVRDWVFKRKVEVVRIGGTVTIPQDAIDDLIARGTTPAIQRPAQRRRPRAKK